MVQRCLRKATGRKHFTLEQLITLLTEIEAILNSQWRSEGVFLVFWKTPLKMSLKNLLKIIYVEI